MQALISEIVEQNSARVFAEDNLTVTLNIEGASEYSKVSYPIRYGRYHEIETARFVFQFDLNGEIEFVQGHNPDWPHPAEWLKRTLANDWIYYSVGSYNDVHNLIGEYYFPCLEYEQNPFFIQNPFEFKSVQTALREWREIVYKAKTCLKFRYPEPLKSFFRSVSRGDDSYLTKRAEILRSINGGLNTVLPPDTRHVDYHVIPVVISEGCLYHCGFCRFKTDRPFSLLEKAQIIDRMKRIHSFLGDNLHNYNAVFLGRHDALQAEIECGGVRFAAEQAYHIFQFDQSVMKCARLFLFGSIGSLLTAKESLFAALNDLPYLTFINVGFESGDFQTMKDLKKPVKISDVKEAFSRMMEINRRYPKLEITANFVLGAGLSEDHYGSILDLVRNGMDRYYNKGAVYFSPLEPYESKTKLLRRFNELKRLNRLPSFIYLVQRL